MLFFKSSLQIQCQGPVSDFVVMVLLQNMQTIRSLGVLWAPTSRLTKTLTHILTRVACAFALDGVKNERMDKAFLGVGRYVK